MTLLARPCKALLPLTLLVAAACVDEPPTAPIEANSSPALGAKRLPPPVLRTLDDELYDMSVDVPGFAGLWLDAEGALVVAGAGITDTAGMVSAVRAAAQVNGITSSLGDGVRSVFRPVRYDFRALVDWKRLLVDHAWQAGILSVDLDEQANDLRIGVEKLGVANSLRDRLTSLGVPADGLVIEVTGRAVPEAELSDKFRPIPAGVLSQSALGPSCSVGVNAWTDLGLGYILSSHCSWRFGNLQDATVFRQNTGSANTVGLEVADPELSPCSLAPSGCRYSDAAFIVYDSTSLGGHGLLARTISPYWSPRVIDANHPHFTINAPSYAFLLAGAVVNKMGQTTGWTQGTVVSTCIDVFWDPISEGSDTFYTYLRCQFGANYGSARGDSGGQIFTWDGTSSSVDFRGLHNGLRAVGSSEKIFSPWRFIDLELNSYVGYIDIAY